MSAMSISRLTTSLILSVVFCAVAQAQYVWIDEKGNKQFSDMPPPKTVPKDKILKAPGAAPKTASSEDKASAPAPETPAKLEKPATLASKNEEFNKRRKEAEEKEKKANEDKQADSEKAKNCDRARNYKQTLESGVRISRTDKSGERSFLDDSQRQQELADVKKALAGC